MTPIQKRIEFTNGLALLASAMWYGFSLARNDDWLAHKTRAVVVYDRVLNGRE